MLCIYLVDLQNISSALCLQSKVFLLYLCHVAGRVCISGIRDAGLFVWCLVTHVAQSNLLTIDWKSNNPFMVERKHYMECCCSMGGGLASSLAFQCGVMLAVCGSCWVRSMKDSISV